MEPLVYLKRDDDWLISHNSHQFTQLAEQLYSQLTQLSQCGAPKILLVERNPVRFLAGFIAACAAGCPVFLCNPNWVEHEWQQVFELVQPDLILGYGDWESAIRKYYPSSQPLLFNSRWIMIPTGGSSGKIRFAIHTWETLMASVQGFQEYFARDSKGNASTSTSPCLPINSFCILPLYHVSGLMQFLRSFTTGGQLAILPFKELAASERCGIDDVQGQFKLVDPGKFFISLVPTQLQRLLNKPESANWLSRFQTVLLGGGPAWSELLELARQYSIKLAPTYGMTETASQIVTLKPKDFLNGDSSCGQVLPHAQVTICSTTGQQLSPSQIGIITIQSKSLALGYYPSFFTKQDKFKSDDLGFFDDQGYLNIVGRSSNKIISGGENVYPSEVEAAIRATQLVKEVCVFGVPDQHWGQAVTAIYVPSYSTITTAAIKAALKDRLSKFKQPKHWLSVESIPRNPQGKVNQEHLQQTAKALPQIRD